MDKSLKRSVQVDVGRVNEPHPELYKAAKCQLLFRNLTIT